jgi:guanine deaminase
VRQLIYAERGADVDFVMVNGEVALRDGRFTRVDEARLLAEIHTEIDGLAEQFAASEASVAPVRAAMDVLYRRALRAEIPGDTYPARLP